MLIRNINNNNDWRFGKGKTDYVKDAYAVGLDIKLKIQEWYQDCFFNLQKGIMWNIRLGEKNQKDLLDNDIYEIATNTEGVLNIYNFISQLDGRRYTCSFEVYQIYSTESLLVRFDSEDIWQTN